MKISCLLLTGKERAFYTEISDTAFFDRTLDQKLLIA